MNDQQEAALANAVNATSKQDRKVPFLININDGRLFPNIPKLSKGLTAKFGKNYRPYHGPVKATQEQRMQYLRSETGTGHGRAAPAVVDEPIETVQPFVINTANLEELTTFAATRYGKVIAPGTNTLSARKMVREFARQAGEFDDGAVSTTSLA